MFESGACKRVCKNAINGIEQDISECDDGDEVECSLPFACDFGRIYEPTVTRDTAVKRVNCNWIVTGNGFEDHLCRYLEVTNMQSLICVGCLNTITDDVSVVQCYGCQEVVGCKNVLVSNVDDLNCMEAAAFDGCEVTLKFIYKNFVSQIINII